MVMQASYGTYTGDAAAQNLELGFVPVFMIAWNETDGDVMWFWISGMGDGDALQVTNHDTAQISVLSANAFTTYAGASGSESEGMTVGTTLSESAKTIRYIAFGV